MNGWANLSIRMSELAQRLHVAGLARAWPLLWLMVLLTWLMGLSLGEIQDHIREGDIAPYDIRADRRYIITNETATAQRRTDALANTKMVYDYDTEAGATLAARIRAAF